MKTSMTPSASAPARNRDSAFGFRNSDFGLRVSALAICHLLLAIAPASAFPPTPHHLIYGTVRDGMGNPIMLTNAEVRMETLTGLQMKTRVNPGLPPGMNYRLTVPLDAGITADNYKPTALRTAAPFTMKVKIGQTVYLPMEMTTSSASVGKPAQSTRLDLTLGADTDGDGLPDDWERALIAMLGGNLTLADIRPEDDSDGDGISNRNEYIAGTYPFDPQDGFRLEMLGVREGRAVIEFLTIPGRRYTLHASEDLNAWSPAFFRVVGDADNAPPRSDYTATDVRFLRIEAIVTGDTPPEKMFFKAQVQ